MEEVDAVVVGAGMVGLATARALARAGHETLVLEATPWIGSGASSRNSEVLHAGLYYPPGSLKARACVEGRQRLHAYLAERGLPHRLCGKLIVSTRPDEEPELHALMARAEACGAHGLRWLEGREAMALEPALRCTAAVLSPGTGIVDSHAYMLSLLGDAQAAGAVLALKSPVRRIRVEPGRLALDVGGEEPMRLATRLLVNAAGLHAQSLAARIEGLEPRHVPPCHWARGHYFAASGRAPFSRLIYPVPEAAGLGVHLTLDLAGQMRFGPDVQWIEVAGEPGHEDYGVAPARMAGFAEAIRRYWPGLPDGALQPAYAGIRAKVQGPGEPARDFVVSGPAEHGVPGLVNLFGIESPGLTSSLVLADAALDALRDNA